MPTFPALPRESWLEPAEAPARLLEKLLDTTSDGVWLIDAAGITTHVNERLASMLGYREADMVGRHLSAFMDEDVQQSLATCLAGSRGGLRAQLECKLKRRQGDTIWVRVATSPLFDDQGRYASGVAVLSDVTLRKQAEEQLAGAEQELERRVAERTRALLEANQRLSELATRDSLTGLLNRRSFDERLDQEIARARRYQAPLSLLLADVDHFKQINDSAGHQTGDAVLRHVAKLLASEVRASDIVGRYGGEEFVILAPHTGKQGAHVLAERIRKAAHTSECRVGSFRAGVTLSIGLAELHAHEGGAEVLFLTADSSLYGAKRAGRNRVGE